MDCDDILWSSRGSEWKNIKSDQILVVIRITMLTAQSENWGDIAKCLLNYFGTIVYVQRQACVNAAIFTLLCIFAPIVRLH